MQRFAGSDGAIALTLLAPDRRPAARRPSQMRPSPLLTALGASVGSLVTLGAATLAVSSVGIAVTKQVVRRRRLAAATPCAVCASTGYLPCGVCGGRGVLRCRAPVRLSELRRRRQVEGQQQGDGVASPVASAMCACPVCGTTLRQRCLNCLGEGRACLPA